LFAEKKGYKLTNNIFHFSFFLLQAIYDMLGACSSNKPADSAEERAKNIFAKMDENNDGQLTQDEFLKGCLQDEELSKMLAP
jgi:hippocalcin-like protein 1